MVPSAYSAGARVFENDLLQEWQKYSCRDMIASVRAGILGSMVNLVQTATAIRDKNWFTQIMTPVSDGSVTSLDVSDRELEPEESVMIQTVIGLQTVEELKRQQLKKGLAWK